MEPSAALYVPCEKLDVILLGEMEEFDEGSCVDDGEVGHDERDGEVGVEEA